MNKVWLVTTGDYSDYRVMCVCATEEIANEIVEIENGNAYYAMAQVEEMELVEQMPTRRICYEIRCDVANNGDAEEGWPHQTTTWSFEEDIVDLGAEVSWIWKRKSQEPASARSRAGTLYVTGTDQQRVQQVFSDRRAMLMTDDAMRSQTEISG